MKPQHPDDLGTHPDCPRCNGTGREPNAQFRCACHWADSPVREAAIEASKNKPAPASETSDTIPQLLNRLVLVSGSRVYQQFNPVPDDERLTDADVDRIEEAIKAQVSQLQQRLHALEGELASERETSRHDPAEQRAERYALEAVDLTQRLMKTEVQIHTLEGELRTAKQEAGGNSFGT